MSSTETTRTEINPFGPQHQPIGLTLSAEGAFPDGDIGYISQRMLVHEDRSAGKDSTPLRCIGAIEDGATVEVCYDVLDNVYVARQMEAQHA